MALLIGIAAGFAAMAFRLGFEMCLSRLYGDSGSNLVAAVSEMPWWWIILITASGGIVVGLINPRFLGGERVHGVADVISGAALCNGRVPRKTGLASIACSFFTLASGGSTGREGPVVHMAAVISAWVSARLNADGITGRDLLGCAVASAVSASFNAPIAGTIFALEVVLRHFSVRTLGPVVIAAVVGTVINRLRFGNMSEFALYGEEIVTFYVELPAFLILGLVCGLVAAAFVKGIFAADDFATFVQESVGMPIWLRTGVAGICLGGLAVFFPEVIGVGYETTSAALTGNLALNDSVTLVIVKCIAVAVVLGGRMGGGVFSPSLMIGALTGLAFGHIATGIFPEVSGSFTLYALAGMGAVAAAVLGAPISTILIVFELTSDWQAALAVMLSVSTAATLCNRIVDRSFFLSQLKRQGIEMAQGPPNYLLASIPVSDLLCRIEDLGQEDVQKCQELVAKNMFVADSSTLFEAMPLLEVRREDFVPVVSRHSADDRTQLVGALYFVDALGAFNDLLAKTSVEEHS